MFDKVLKKYNLEFDSVDLTVPQTLERHRKNNTRLVWLESPSNPLLKLVDIEAIASIAKKAYYISRC